MTLLEFTQEIDTVLHKAEVEEDVEDVKYWIYLHFRANYMRIMKLTLENPDIAQKYYNNQKNK